MIVGLQFYGSTKVSNLRHKYQSIILMQYISILDLQLSLQYAISFHLLILQQLTYLTPTFSNISNQYIYFNF